MRLGRRGRVLATTTAAGAVLALVPAVTTSPAGAGPVSPAASPAPPQTMRGMWAVSGPGVREGVRIKMGTERGRTARLRIDCGGGVEAIGLGGIAWERAAEGPFAASVETKFTCGDERVRMHWLRRAAWAEPSGSGWVLSDRSGRTTATLTPAKENAGVLVHGGPGLAAARRLPKGVEPAGRKALRGRWFAADRQGRRLDTRPVARVRKDGTYRAMHLCGAGPVWHWSVDRPTGAFVAVSGGTWGPGLSCSTPTDPVVVARVERTEAFASAARAGRQGRFLVLTDRRGHVIGRYLRG